MVWRWVFKILFEREIGMPSVWFHILDVDRRLFESHQKWDLYKQEQLQNPFAYVLSKMDPPRAPAMESMRLEW